MNKWVALSAAFAALGMTVVAGPATAGKASAKQFVVVNEIYRHLEKVCDRCEDVGNQIDGLVIDHA